MAVDNPPDGFLRIDFDRGSDPTFNSHIGTLYARRGPKGMRDEFVMGFRVHQHMCNPAGGLHGGMMMSVADLVGTMGGGTQVGLRKFLPTVSMTFGGEAGGGVPKPALASFGPETCRSQVVSVP